MLRDLGPFVYATCGATFFWAAGSFTSTELLFIYFFLMIIGNITLNIGPRLSELESIHRDEHRD